MKESTRTRLIEVKKEFHAAMNGMAAASMRQAGILYHVNFGIELPRLRQIAGEFEADHELAQELWKEDVRESQLLATMLQPLDSFTPELADVWVERITTTEVAEVASMNVFSLMSGASEKAFEWLAGEESMKRVCGYLVLLHLMRRSTLSERSADELMDQAVATLQEEQQGTYLSRLALKTLQSLVTDFPDKKTFLQEVLNKDEKELPEKMRTYCEYLLD